MKTLMKQFSLLVVLVLFTGVTAYAQQSDYQIQQNFQTEVDQLMQRIEEADTTAELEEIEMDIDDLVSTYSEHDSLLTVALYPDTYDDVISNLRSAHSDASEKLSTIEDLNQRVNQLVTEMDTVRSRLDELNQERESLMAQIQRSEENESRQAALIRQYRQNIEQRNIFVANFLENLLSKYQTMDPSTQEEVTEAAERMEENPLDVINNVITEYINMMEQTSALEAPDYISMRAQHGYFSEVWNNIGEQLTNTFAPDNPVQTQEEVNDLLSTWRTSIDENLWESIGNSFSQNGIEVSGFSSSEALYDSLNSYIDRSHEISLETNSEEDYQKYQNFNSYWNNTMKAEWGEMLTEGNILTQTQISAIDMKLDEWQGAAAPTSNLTFILLLISIAVIIGLVVLLLTRKGGTSSSSSG